MVKEEKMYSMASSVIFALCFFFSCIGVNTLEFGKRLLCAIICGTVFSLLFLFLSGKKYTVVGYGLFLGSVSYLAFAIFDSILKTTAKLQYGLQFSFDIDVAVMIPLASMFFCSFAVVVVVRMIEKVPENSEFVDCFRIISIAVLVFTVVLYVVCFGVARVANNENSVNFIPFKTMAEYVSWYKSGNWIEPLIQFGGNIMFFFVFGFYLPICFRKANKWVIIAVPFVLSIGIELSQLILKNGNSDIDDVILNVAGFFMGYGVMICVEIISSLIKQSDELMLVFNKKSLTKE